ncbi:NAC domain-containing protein 17-like [Rutidosis leptorrhynchoides]|uniref:NAC domain-containing protein 17-like n=1 Tax=Rutidosis leptorrhynchoides TaxID=125765 RepID=UPI003A9922D3
MGSELIDAATVSKSRSKSSAGKSFPPGFRFHPTDEELVLYYLKRKICRRSVKLDIIGEVDVYKWDPEELPGLSKLKTGDRQWFFFSPRDRKYPNGRSSRATRNGYWKATGKDRNIKRKSFPAGIKKTLVYYHGRAPTGLRTDWVMHEYTMDEEELKRCLCEQDHLVLYKIFKKSGPGPKNGEQYGAPFVEEEWSDDEFVDIDSRVVQKLNPIPVNEFGNTRDEGENLLSNDIVEYLNKIVDEPELLPPLPQISDKPENCLLEGSSSVVEKLFDEDFLEMDDLIGPQLGSCNSGLQFADFDSFSEFGTRHIELQGAYMDNLDYGPENSGLVSEVTNRDYVVNDELPISYDLWNHDQGISSIMTIQDPVSNPSSSGVVLEENSGISKSKNSINECSENNMKDNTESWFSSALWSFVDAIPTTPASASESSALVNKAFERLSSFSRIQSVSLPTATAGADSGNSTTKRSEKPKPSISISSSTTSTRSSSSSRGIVYFSVLGVLCAVLWVFIGSSIELLDRFVWW